MRRVVLMMMVAVSLFLATGSAQVSGQASCTFQQGFAALRDLIGEQTVGACLDNEQVNADNGNTEQRTTGGLLVWRKIDNFTAFTDGGSTWVNGPNGLESRPNDQRLAWELDPATAPRTAPSPTPRPIPTFPPPIPTGTGPISAPRVAGGEGTISQPHYGAQTGSPVPPAPPATVANAPSGTGTTAAGAQAGTVPPPPPPPPGDGAPTTSNAASAGSASPTTANVAAIAATPTKTPTPTRTPTPKPAVTVKFLERPDDVDTGADARFKVQTNAKKGTCSLVVGYRNTADAVIGGAEIDDDGQCEWKFNLAPSVKTGKAKAVVTVFANSGSATAEDTFEVKKGDTVYAGSVDIDLEVEDLPENVDLGQEFKVDIESNLKRKGSCELSVTWPKVGPVASESQMPDDKGRCSWKVKAPTDVPTKSTATLVVTVRKDGGTYRSLTKEIKVGK